MEKEVKTNTQQISRRKFLGVTGGITFVATISALIPTISSCKKEENIEDAGYGEKKKITVWVHIREDGQIIIFNPAAEMGQGSMTALPVILAEELDADWANVTIENSPVEPEIYGAGWGGGNTNKSMITVGSRTVNSFYNNMRQAGAQARFVLLSNVADKWNVPVEELKTEPGIVIHEGSQQRISYGEIAGFAGPVADIPEIPDHQLKDPEQFRLIGKVIPRYDIPDKVDGSAVYSMDIKLPDMVYAVINRSPVNGSSPQLMNEQEIRQLSGILEIITMDHGIALIADSIESALKARKDMQIQWSQGAKAGNHSSQEALGNYESIAGSTSFDGDVITSDGNVDRAKNGANKTYRADYKNDYVYHAQMEPLNAVASVSQDGTSVEAWVGTQAPGNLRNEIAEVSGIDRSNVLLHRQYLGGGFGRRSEADYVVEAVLLSKEVRRPVKLLWTREDDVRYGKFRPMSLQRMEASVDADGNVTGWKHTIVGTGGGLLTSGAGIPFYSIPNQHIERRDIEHGVRTKHWRAVGHGANKYAIEAFIDEIASDQKKDPYEFRMNLMKESPRAQKVLRKVAEMADWNGPVENGHAKGISFAERSGSLAACVCELSVDTGTGMIRVHHLWASLDAGVVVQPDNVLAQMEGGMLMGLSSVLKESITFQNGEVQQSNFDDYPILRFEDIPDHIDIELIPSTEHPTGIGEAGIPIIGGAVANAFYTLTGKRLRHMPFTPDKVKAALQS